MKIITLPGQVQRPPPPLGPQRQNRFVFDFLYESLEALKIMGACYVINVRGECPEALSFKGAWPVIDDRIENLMTLRFKEACFVIDFRCVSLKATIFMVVYCLIHLFLRQVLTAITYYCIFYSLFSWTHYHGAHYYYFLHAWCVPQTCI